MHVGLDLQSAVFSHGQLYALSRCTSANCIKVLLPNCENRRTPNIVYKEVLNGLHLTCEYAVIFSLNKFINTYCCFRIQII